MARTKKTQSQLIAEAKAKGFVVGWADIGKSLGMAGTTLAVYSSSGKLKLKPKKIGTAVAFSPAQIASLTKSHLSTARA